MNIFLQWISNATENEKDLNFVIFELTKNIYSKVECPLISIKYFFGQTICGFSGMLCARKFSAHFDVDSK